jgi:poly(U)-specific endoribonuclease
MKRYLKQLWFAHYSRARGLSDTSGFEHIFIGETKNGEISGLHNWLRFYRLEKRPIENFGLLTLSHLLFYLLNSLDYRGFLVKRGATLAAIKFFWRNQPKRSGTLLIGTSPEFDFAVYTLCFLSRRGRNTCNFELDSCPMTITSYDIRQNRQVFIGSAFPSGKF